MGKCDQNLAYAMLVAHFTNLSGSADNLNVMNPAMQLHYIVIQKTNHTQSQIWILCNSIFQLSPNWSCP